MNRLSPHDTNELAEQWDDYQETDLHYWAAWDRMWDHAPTEEGSHVGHTNVV